MDRTLGPGEMGDLGAEVFDLGVWVKRGDLGLKVLSSGPGPRSMAPGQGEVGGPEVPE